MSEVALITGASRGIGLAIGEELFLKGYSLSLLSRSIEVRDLDKLLAQRCDVTSTMDVETAVSNTLDKFGRIDVLVNSAGISHVGTIGELTLEDLDKVYDVNVRGTFNASKAVLPFMKKRNSGYIINIGSLRAIECGSGKAAYCMSKSAVRAFSKTLKKEVEDYGIKVTVINPGFVNTDIYGEKSLRPYIQPGNGGDLKAVPVTEPEDIAKSVLYLLGLSRGAYVEELNIGRLFGKEQTSGIVLRAPLETSGRKN